MFYREHEPAHFHAEHQGQQGKFDFSGKMLVGDIKSRTALRLIQEWARLHRAELEANWANMKEGKPLDRIPPLEQGAEMTLPSVVHAEHRGGFQIHLTFNDGSEGTVVWPNGADIAPETLYDAVRATRSDPALQPSAPMKTKRRG